MVDDSVARICNPLHITNITGFGALHRNVIYSETNAIIATTFPDQFITTPWEEVRAIRVLDHPYTTLEIFIPPVDRASVIPNTTTVIGIDLPLFAYKLKGWLIQNNKKTEGARENLSEFISKYVLPLMVVEYYDIAIRNRLPYLSRGEPVPKERYERGFIQGYETTIDLSVVRILSAIKGSNKPYLKGLAEIPMIYSSDYLSALPMSIASLDSYSYWVTFYTFVNWAYPITYLFDKDFGNSTNILTILHRVDRLIKNNHYLGQMDDNMRTTCLAKYNEIKEKFST
jgi:hypothetical protein